MSAVPVPDNAEVSAVGQGAAFADLDLAAQEALWQQVKRAERGDAG